LLARIDALGRRCMNTDDTDDVFEIAPYKIDRRSRKILKNDIAISTTTIEFDLALFLFRNYGRVLSRGYILENVWGRNADVTTRTVDTHISRIRKKLGIVPETGWKLAPVYQHGYRLEKLD
jgi:DNA-binding response OmpR family regulator